MREIKFRFWDKEYDRMLGPYGLVEISDMSVEDLECMQFTGLKDKNGKEIYEGDIVRDIDGGPTHLVEYNAPYFALYRHAEGYPKHSEYENMIIEPYALEVIGNFHENPDLLEPK